MRIDVLPLILSLSLHITSMQNEKSVLPNIYKWIAENPEYCSINSNTLTYKFLGFLDEIYGFYCNICPEAPENEIAKMACAEVIMEDTGKQVVCHESMLKSNDAQSFKKWGKTNKNRIFEPRNEFSRESDVLQSCYP